MTQAAETRSIQSIFAVDPAWFFYRPFGKLVWFVGYHLWGYHSGPYHLLSLGLHVINALLVVRLVSYLKDEETSRWVAWGAGLLFALSPLQIETVVWPASIYDLLATLWYLTSLLCLLAFWQEQPLRFYLLSLVAYQLCLWSKEIAFTLPMLVVVIGLLGPQRRSTRTLILSVLPFGILLLTNLLQRYLTWGNLGGYSDASTKSFVVDALVSNLRLMIAPANQYIVPSPIRYLWLSAGTVGLIVGLWIRPKSRLLWLAGLWLLCTLLPVAFLKVGDDLQNSRILYLPSVGFYFGAAVVFTELLQRLPSVRGQVAYGFGVMCLLFLAVLHLQVQPWIFAGQETLHIVQELHRFVPVFKAQGKYQTRLQVIGLPDNYKGAYLYRIGLDLAFLGLYGSFFDVEHVPQFPALSYAEGYATFQVAYGVDSVTKRWQITQARGVTAGSRNDEPGPGHVQNWNFGMCASTTSWTVSQAQQTCDQHGLHIDTGTNDPTLISPIFNTPATGWTEVQIVMAREGQTNKPSALQVFWTTSDRLSWNEHQSDTLSLPTNQTLMRYHFFLPPNSRSIRRLRIDPLSTPGTVTIQSVTMRAIP